MLLQKLSHKNLICVFHFSTSRHQQAEAVSGRAFQKSKTRRTKQEKDKTNKE
jgi:hypothetical protein